MRILFVCDLNSIHAQKWVAFFIKKKHEVSIYSTTPYGNTFLRATVFSGKISPVTPSNKQGEWAISIFQFIPSLLWTKIIENLFVIKKTLLIRQAVRHHTEAISQIVSKQEPDIIHALRIPNEGFIAARIKNVAHVVVSTWGNDLTYWAKKRLLKKMTLETLKRADFLLSDCKRDVRLGLEYGYSSEKPFLVVPGAGGMSDEHLNVGRSSLAGRSTFFEKTAAITQQPIFLSLRGFGSQDIDNVPLVKACSIAAEGGLEFTLIIVGRKGGFRYHKLDHLMRQLRLHRRLLLMEELTHPQALEALQSADFSISVARNDGVPNSMLEAMTFGAIPLMSNIESIREWIEDGKNGYLLDPSDPWSIADAMQRAMKDSAFYDDIRRMNYELVSKRGNYTDNMVQVEQALEKLVARRNGRPT